LQSAFELPLWENGGSTGSDGVGIGADGGGTGGACTDGDGTAVNGGALAAIVVAWMLFVILHSINNITSVTTLSSF